MTYNKVILCVTAILKIKLNSYLQKYHQSQSGNEYVKITGCHITIILVFMEILTSRYLGYFTYVIPRKNESRYPVTSYHKRGSL